MVKLTLDTYLQAVGVTRYQLSKQAEINYQIIDNYYKNKVVRYDSDVLDRICSALHCRIEDILSFTASVFTPNPA